MENPWKTHSSKKIYDNPWITLIEHQVTNPNGGDGIYGKVHFKNIALGIIPLDENCNTWLVGQYRYPLEEYSWEIPMGGGLITANRLDAAKRELKEETGLTATKWTEILKIHTSNSVTDEVGYAYLAQELSFGETEFDDTEQLEIRKLPFEEAVKMCENGQITDGLSQTAIYRLARMI